MHPLAAALIIWMVVGFMGSSSIGGPWGPGGDSAFVPNGELRPARWTATGGAALAIRSGGRRRNEPAL